MSRHISRRAKWIELSPIRFGSVCGYVQKNTYGRWDGFLVYLSRPPLKDFPADRPWRRCEVHVGERRRPREAMMAVEAKRRELLREADEDLRL